MGIWWWWGWKKYDNPPMNRMYPHIYISHTTHATIPTYTLGHSPHTNIQPSSTIPFTHPPTAASEKLVYLVSSLFRVFKQF